MNARAVFIGTEADAAGYRIAGLETVVAEAGAESQALARSREQAALVLVSAGVAARIPDPVLREAVRALEPLTVVVPDVLGSTALPDVAARLRRELGLEG